MDYGNLPQNRERIYMVCFNIRDNIFKNFDLNNKNIESLIIPNKIKLTRKINDLIDQKKQDEYFYYMPDHQYYQELNSKINKTDTVYQWRRAYVRENQSNVCPTLTANMGTGGHNVPIIKDKYGIRKFTPRECARFQGMPDNFIFPKDMARSHLYKQIGNSVSMPVITRIALNILNILDEYSKLSRSPAILAG